MSLQTRYDFTLPRGYVDANGQVHRNGTMRLATARDELEPLRDPSVQGPDDPRLTVLVLARVVERLGALELVTTYEIEGLFAADLAFLQDFYGVINFGSQDEYEALLEAQERSGPLPGTVPVVAVADVGPAVPAAAFSGGDEPEDETSALSMPAVVSGRTYQPSSRAGVEEIPNGGR
ncbi:MAG: hypothetical protein JWN61_189 [Pseudonocardiales bacterium]|nr:hypothetical protein [Jatrophihabitantaceae bacterium]MCW2602054.1 hypothetical protein [Pseudonocardiales bacterium]